MRLFDLFEDQQKDFLSQLKTSLQRLKTKGVELHMESTTTKDQRVIQCAKMFGPEVQKVEDVIKNAKSNGTARKAMRTILKDWKERQERHSSKMMKARGNDFNIHAGYSRGFRELLNTTYPLNFDVRLDKSTKNEAD